MGTFILTIPPRGAPILTSVTLGSAPLYPVFLDLHGVRVVVVGGGEVGLRKARGACTSGARVCVVAPSLHPDFAGLDVTLTLRPYEAGDLQGAQLVFACTDRDEVNDRVAADARELGLFCNHASRPEQGSLRLGATFSQGSLQVAVSSGAELPYLAQALRDRLRAALPGELPVREWAARREAALALPEPQRALVLSTLRAEIHKAVGA